MSGIAGILNLDGAPVDPAVLQRMAEAAAHLGPDGIRYWTDGPVGLAHLALHTTPESVHEQQPLVARQGELVLVADARVDNRDELISTLTAKGSLSCADPTDADLILAAYEMWGDECPDHILGDLAFAVWDGQTHRLLCARDPFGMRPLFYSGNGQAFLFASMARQILAHGAVPARLNERAIAYYLTGRPYDFLTEGAYFEGIRRVRPAHTLSVTWSGGLTQRRYWDIDRKRQLCYNTDEAYAEELLHLLTQAVKAHSRSQRPVAVFTSGGMDSSSIACLLGKLREEGQGADFKMVSFVYGEGHPVDEKEYIDAIAARYDLDIHYIDGLQHLPLTESAYAGQCDDEPPRLFNEPLWHAACAEVAGPGCRVALIGQGGDSLFALSYGILFCDLLLQGRLLECMRGIRSIPRWNRRRLALAMSKHLGRAIAPMWLWKAHRMVGRPGEPAWIKTSFVNPLIADAPLPRWGFRDYGFAYAHQAARYCAISDWLYPVETALQHLAGCHGLVVSDPYTDRRLVEFALALPIEQLYHRGVTKRVLRNATTNIVPDSVRLLRTKGTAVVLFRQGLTQRLAAQGLPRVSEWTAVERGYLCGGALAEALDAYHAAPTASGALALRKPLWLEQWLVSVQGLLVNRSMDKEGCRTYE